MRADRLQDMARFAVHLRIPPAHYWAMTAEEHDAIVSEFNASQKR